ncbi:Putative CENP-V/GFA domain, Mss4-like superfamily protein [Septoria linicola]|uniref:CENP-V/GFA domain, Mss4-like superfamily protein n=1 Tax=Septoria linicola TaxID=215465 RepID=A0A9Q9ATK5_9PEZI|nr:Putative CENP-V/GFA domain, Mss4-like superfamily protein [Septoria linicola]
MLARCLTAGDNPSSEATWNVTTGTLEDIDGALDWRSHEHIQDTRDGGFADMLLEVNRKELQRWPAHFPYHAEPSDTSDPNQELPVYGQSLPQSPTTDRLHRLQGHCKCGGVSFYVARPSARSALAKKVWPKLPSMNDIEESNVPDETETFWLRDHGTKFLAGLCACNSCRLASGMETTFWAFVPTVDLSIGKNGEEPFTFDFGTLKKYTSSDGCHRYFCNTCGATCFYDADDRKFMKDVAIGLLTADGARAESWLGWRTNRLGYREDSMPRAGGLTVGIERGLQAWEKHRTGEDLSGPIRTGGAL